MKFKVGDRVSFLNDTGGGIVTRIVDESLVHVTIEDGFEIPVMAKELLKTGTAEIAEDIERAHQKIKASRQIPEVVEDSGLLPLYLAHNNPHQRPEGLYFCFTPQVQENPLSGPLDITLINHTSYYSLFSLFQNFGTTWKGLEYGIIEPESRLQLDSIGRSEIEKWANALWQTVFFKEDKAQPVAPYSGLINFRPIKLYKEESFQFETLLRIKTFMVPVMIMSEQLSKPLNEEKISTEALKSLREKIVPQGQSTQSGSNTPPNSFLEKHKIDDKIAEVDLHIGELIEDFTNLEPADLLSVQIDYFNKCIKQAEKEKLSKVIFIHGVGNGKLKQEIQKLLTNHDGIDFYDAPFARYGLGATEVNFYRNK